MMAINFIHELCLVCVIGAVQIISSLLLHQNVGIGKNMTFVNTEVNPLKPSTPTLERLASSHQHHLSCQMLF
jgi:hypothetical protein